MKFSKILLSYLVIIVLEVRILALQLNHLQANDPLLFFVRHKVRVRVPAFTFSSGKTLKVNSKHFIIIL